MSEKVKPGYKQTEVRQMENKHDKEEGIPYQTLIASVLHKFIAGRLVEKSSRITSRTTGRAKKLRADLE